jgi:hypothetical protein
MKKVLLWTTLAVALIGGIAGFVGLLVHMLTPEPIEPLPVRTAIASAEFSNGDRLDVLLHGEGSITDGLTSAPMSFWKSHSSGSSSSAFADASVKTFTIDSVLSGIQFSTDNSGNLLLELRLVDSFGDPLKAERCLKNGEIMSASGPRTNRPKWTAGAAATMTQPDADATKWPEFVVQLNDGAGGWITGTGPMVVDSDLEHRCGMMFQGWPRTSDPLVFRALRPGVPPVEFQVPNPAPAGLPAAWTVSPFPRTHKNPDFTLTLKHVHQIQVPDRGRFLAPSHDFQSRFPNDNAGNHRNDKLNCEFIDIEGALGSRGRAAWLEMDNGIVSAAAVPPDESLFRARYRVERLSAFPRPLAGTEIIAEVEVGTDGKTLTTTWQSSSHGFKTLTLGALGAKRGQQAFDIEVEFEWKSPSARSAADAVFGSWDELIPVVFIDGNSESEGSGGFSGQSSSSGGLHSSISLNGDWFGTLKPKQKIRIGLTQSLPPTEILFTFDRSAISE